MVTTLIEKADSSRLLTVEITASTVQVGVVYPSKQVAVWAYRNGEISQVATDLTDVGQASFDISEFTISDVGALFRAAAGASGSDQGQTLTIVDNSGGVVSMSVATVPESRTVFFNADGSLLEILDFNTAGGIARGLDQAVGSHAMVYSLSIQSDQGVTVTYPGAADHTVHRTRTAKVPVTIVDQSDKTTLPLFNAGRVSASVIWEVICDARTSGTLAQDGAWSVVVDARDKESGARMYFSFAGKQLVTDLAGATVSE